MTWFLAFYVRHRGRTLLRVRTRAVEQLDPRDVDRVAIDAALGNAVGLGRLRDDDRGTVIRIISGCMTSYDAPPETHTRNGSNGCRLT